MASPDEIWLVDFGDPFPGESAHRRPALVVGPPPTFGGGTPFVLLCPLTTSQRALSLHVELEATSNTGLAETSYVQCELLRSVNSRRLVHRLGSVDPATSGRVAEIIDTLLGR